jgi:UDP-N-acetylmuramyl pentapeptide phosphotransferase/UDP-N-acetylglucosamine-1-phosphate transferase
MRLSWMAAFGIAAVITLAVTPWVSSRAVRRGGLHARAPLTTASTPLVAVLAGSLVVLASFDTPLAVGCVAAAWLWWGGFLAERGRLPRQLLPVAQGATAVALVLGGLRLEVTGVEGGDTVVTVAVVWLVLMAWRSAETRDNLLLGWSAVIASGAALIAGLSHQRGVTGVSAACAGACLGFLPYVVPPIAARLRTSAALFIGCIVIVVALDAHPDVRPPGMAVPALLMLALPLVEGVMSGAARLRDRRVDLMRSGLIGRWRALGASRPLVAVVLVGAQAALSMLAVLVARAFVRPEVGALIGVTMVLLVTLPAMLARRKRVGARWPEIALVLGGGVVVGAALLTVPAAIGLWHARGDATAAASAIQRGVDATRAGNTAAASAAFADAAQHFDTARRRLGDPLVSWGAEMPVIGPNLHAARELTAIGADLARTGRRLTTTADVQRLRIVNASVNLAEVHRLEPELVATTTAIEDAQERVRRIDRDFLVGPVDDAIGKLEKTMRHAVHQGRTASLAAKVLPSVFGGDTSKRYVLALQNPAEARATGGIFGNWGEIAAVGGELDLVELGKSGDINPKQGEARFLHAPADYVARYQRFFPERFWQDANLSPDLPTSGSVAADLWAQSGRPPVDGVITVDPVGLAAALKLTGPITVEQWPAPINAANVVDVTLKQAYVAFADDNQARDEFLGDVMRAAWRALKSRDLGSPAAVLRRLGNAARGKHIMLWFKDPAAERLARRAGVAGAVESTRGDSLLVTTQNAAANKMDVYLTRTLTYRARLVPRHDGGITVSGTVDVGLRNDGPSTGLPQYVIGPNSKGLVAGDNRTLLSVYTPLGLQRAVADGARTTMESARELGRSVYSSTPVLRSGAARELALTVDGTVRAIDRHRYRLTLLHQAGIVPTPTKIDLRLPAGWRFTDAHGLRIVGEGRRAVLDASVDRDLTLSARVIRDRGSGLWARLEEGEAGN